MVTTLQWYNDMTWGCVMIYMGNTRSFLWDSKHLTWTSIFTTHHNLTLSQWIKFVWEELNNDIMTFSIIPHCSFHLIAVFFNIYGNSFKYSLSKKSSSVPSAIFLEIIVMEVFLLQCCVPVGLWSLCVLLCSNKCVCVLV